MCNIRLADPVEIILHNRDLIMQNWQETGFDFEFEPDLDTVRAMCNSGIMFCLGAYDGERTIGYSTAMICPHWFNPEVTMCMSDGLFVDQDHRHTSVGGRLIIATEQEAKRRGASRMLWHTRAGTKLSDAFEKRGYQPADVVMMKGL